MPNAAFVCIAPFPTTSLPSSSRCRLSRLLLRPPPSFPQPLRHVSFTACAESADRRAPSSPDDDTDIFVLEDSTTNSIPFNDYPFSIPSSRVPRHGLTLTDVALVLCVVCVVYGLVVTTSNLFSTTPYSSLSIQTSLSLLPSYAAQSLTRMTAAYLISLLFSISYAYLAYRFRFAASTLILLIDILQSIPLLSFLPGVVLALIAIFPGARIGVELAAVFLLVTSMAWNLLLGFYQVLLGLPSDLHDVASAFQLSPWKRFWTLELPAGATSLVWNSVLSVAGGWFFLISIESFQLGARDFKLPGLGSFLAAAAEAADYPAICAALAVIVAIIVAVDFAVWRPLMAWTAKFNHSATAAGTTEDRPKSIVLNALQKSSLVRAIHTTFIAPAWDDFVNLRYRNPLTGSLLFNSSPLSTTSSTSAITQQQQHPVHTLRRAVCAVTSNVPHALALALPFAAWPVLAVTAYAASTMVRTLSPQSWLLIGTSALATFARVLIALSLSLLWTIPAGVAIGRSPALARTVQPLVQVAASIPATALFPFVLLFLARLGGGLHAGSVALMMLGTMWYILFNVIAGAQAIPSELFDVDRVYTSDAGWKAKWTTWRSLILPGVFPYLVTGVVTAVGGAWNASIVSEYVIFHGQILKTNGLGALISSAAAAGDYPLLLASTVVMSLLVLLTNKLVWAPLYNLAETKYRI